MRTLASPARPFPLWHLLLIALCLGVLALFCPGRSAAEIRPTSDVLVPYFEVDLSDPQMGATTLFAVVNDSPQAVDVLMIVHSNWGIPLLRIPLGLHGDEVRSFNLRDWIVRGNLPDRQLTPAELAHVQAALSGRPSPQDNLYYGTEDEELPDLAVGYVTIRTTGPDRPDVLWGDYYSVDGRHGVFQAETLVDIDPIHGSLPTACKRHGVRFLNAGYLSHGTQLLIWTERHWAPSSTPAPVPASSVAAEMNVYDEPGRLVEDRSLGLLPVQVVEVDHLNLEPKFGWLDILTDEPAFITEHLHTLSTPSATLHAYCLPEETSVPGAGIELQKFVNGADADQPTGPAISVGASVTWDLQVKNTGSLPLTGVAVTDNGAAVACPQTTLEPKEVITCTLVGIAKACQQHNVARVVAYTPDFTEIFDEDPAYYFGEPHASLGLVTRVNGIHVEGPESPRPEIPAGEVIHWTFEATNTGDVELTRMAVTANALAVSCPKTVLQPGESMTCTATSLAEAGQHSLIATVTGATPCGTASSVSQADYGNYEGMLFEPGIDLEKLIDDQDADLPPGPAVEMGAAVTWKFVVTNIGDTVLSGVAVADPALGTVACPKSDLAIGESMTCTVPATARACQVSNLATATATAPDASIVSDQDPAHYYGNHHAALALDKLVEGQDADTAPGPDLRTGTTAHWTYVATNTGNVPLTGVTVTDDRLAAVTCPKTELAAGESMTCTAEGTVAAGQYRNVGTAVGSPPCGAAVSAGDPANHFGRSPAIALEKLTNGQEADTPPGPGIPVGGAVLWTYVVTNTGDTVLTGIAVTDDRGVAVTCPKAALSPGESMTCTASGTAVAGQYANVGTATGTPPVGTDVTATDPSHYHGTTAGGQGCTPGYWKNHTGSWPPTSYSPGQDVDTVFTNVATFHPALGNATLLAALAFGGGPGDEGAAEILLRAAVAALLNSSHPDVTYPRAPAEVIGAVNAALLQSRDPMLTLAAQLDADNNLGCPLN